ncbi:peptidoglycan-binding protein [Capilliphycus salinus ALCB114379]|uniref:peptidoglycan-binding domain-containing protein n=1 Tax=Capilliphycus salinus TaxID=2768948 RepID=UPI0039A5C153
MATLGTVIAFSPVFLLGTPARSQAVVVDGRFDEYGYEVPNLTYGATGPAVQDLQIFLDELGYYDNSYGITGTYDTATQDAVEAFQTDYGLSSPDGIVDNETWDTFISMDDESIFESDDSFDAETGIYTDYEDEGFANEPYENEGYGNEPYENEGFGNEPYQDEGLGNEPYQDEGFGNEPYQDEGLGNEPYQDEGFGNESYENEGLGNEPYENEY